MAKNLREEAVTYQRAFEQATRASNNNIDSYLKVSNTIDFIQQVTKPYTQNTSNYDKTILIMGPTGVGKSTLINYVSDKPLYFKIYNDKPGIFPQDNASIAYVGHGEGSTTLAPNIWQPSTGHFMGTTFIDCAGDFDSAGTVIEIINSKIKATVAKNVKSAKILIVTSQGSIGPEGSYGVVFKAGLEKSAQFLNDIDSFQNSIGLIVSHAGRIIGTDRTVEAFINNVIANPQVQKYKPTLEKIVQKKHLETFSKYSDESVEGTLYAPPAWNVNQKDKIIQLIDKIVYKTIPANLFNDTSSAEVREQMSNAFNIIKIKAVSLLKTSMQNATKGKIILHTTELKKFTDFVETKIVLNKLQVGLEQYVKHLNTHNFFKVAFSEEMRKLSSELDFVAPFTRIHEQSQQVQEDWGTLIDSNLLFKDIIEKAKIIIHSSDELFSNFVDKGKIKTIGNFSELSDQLKKNVEDLSYPYAARIDIENSKNSDKYYRFETEQKFKGLKSVYSHTEQQPYTVQESYVEKNVPYQDVESYIEHQWFHMAMNHYKPGPLGLKILDFSNPSNFELIRCFNHVPGSSGRIEHHEGSRTFTCSSKPVTLTRSVIKYKDETRTKDVTKYNTVTRYKDVPEYEDIKVKKFNESYYNQELQCQNHKIKDIENIIYSLLNQIKSINAQKKQSLPLQITNKAQEAAKQQSDASLLKNDGISMMFKQIKEDWKYLEFEAQSLTDYQIEIAGDTHVG